MVYSSRGNFGIPSNVESVSYTCAEIIVGSNPTLTARKQRTLLASSMSELQAVLGSVQMRESFLVLRSFLPQLLLDHFLDRVGRSFIIAAHHVRINIQRAVGLACPRRCETVLSGTPCAAARKHGYGAGRGTGCLLY